ncbi:MAG: hypothetical protein C5S48_02970 [Candidatus Methanogaster sp.]|nr:MAG: hypothetical protein C5S48_02970 [ANME-2 cluster archaeon]
MQLLGNMWMHAGERRRPVNQSAFMASLLLSQSAVHYIFNGPEELYKIDIKRINGCSI